MAIAPRMFMFDEPAEGITADETADVPRMIDHRGRDRMRCTRLAEHRRDQLGALAQLAVMRHDGRCVADGRSAMVISVRVVQTG